MASSLSRCFTSAAASTAVGSPPLVLIQVPDSLGDGEGGPISVDFLALEALVMISKSSSVLGVKCSVAEPLFRPSDMVVDLFADKLGWDVSPPLLSWQAGAVKDADWLLDEISKALASSDPISVPLVVDCFTGLVEALDPFPSGSPSIFPALRALRRLKRANFLEGGRPGPIIVATAMSSHSPLDHRLIEDEADVIVTITPLVTSKSQNKSSVYETLVVRKSASSGKVVTEKAGAAIEFKGGRWRMEFVDVAKQSTGANAKRPDRGASDTGSSVSAGMGEMKVDGGPGRGQKKGAAVQLEMSEGPKPADKQNEKVKPVIFMQDDDEAFDDLDSDDPDDDLDL